MSVNEDLADLLIGHRLQLLRFEGGTARALVEAYQRALAGVVDDCARLATRMEAATTDSERAHLREQLGKLRQRAYALRDRIREVEPIMAAELDGALAETIRAELRLQSVRVARTVRLSWTVPPEEQVLTAVMTSVGGPLPRDLLRRDLLAAADGVEQLVARAVAQGLSMDRAARALRDAGILAETYRGRFVAIARTEIQRVANEAALRTYAANADVLSGVEWLATLDSRTCLLCAPLHGKVYPLGPNGRPVGMPSIPRHPRCRCFAAPVVRPYKDLDFRLADDTDPDDYDGAPSGGPTFDQWLARQPAATQEEVLGPARYQLWRAGLPLDRFSDARGLLTLGQLAS